MNWYISSILNPLRLIYTLHVAMRVHKFNLQLTSASVHAEICVGDSHCRKCMPIRNWLWSISRVLHCAYPSESDIYFFVPCHGGLACIAVCQDIVLYLLLVRRPTYLGWSPFLGSRQRFSLQRKSCTTSGCNKEEDCVCVFVRVCLGWGVGSWTTMLSCIIRKKPC